jgi:3-oxoacyl-[acyl-carrier-protein] synthase II
MLPIYLTGINTISALGDNETEIIENYRNPQNLNVFRNYGNQTFPIFPAKLPPNYVEDNDYDPVTKIALTSANNLISNLDFNYNDVTVLVGTARGATATLENRHHSFITNNKVVSSTSPLTTLGGISSVIANSIKTTGVAFGGSMTCVSFLQALFLGIALIESGRAIRCLIGGTEAPLTPFTIAQMNALRIYSKIQDNYPCRPLGLDKNTLTLGEGAGFVTIENEDSLKVTKAKPIAKICGISTVREKSITATGIDEEGLGFKASMNQVLLQAELSTVDSIVLHAPGTILGDNAELCAVKSIFPVMPKLYSTKYLTGHTFGASGVLSLHLGLLLLNNKITTHIPYHSELYSGTSLATNSVVINSAGFGGVVASIVIAKV